MKLLNQAKKFGSKVVYSTPLAFAAPMAFADVPVEIQTEITAGRTMGIAIATAVLGVIVAIAIYKHVRRGA